jgi:hypothetical protein
MIMIVATTEGMTMIESTTADMIVAMITGMSAIVMTIETTNSL